jgi:EpsI family protein
MNPTATRALVLTGLFVIFGGWLTIAARPAVPPARIALRELPLEIDAWHGQNGPPFTARVLAVLGADDYISRVYGRGTAIGRVGLYAGYYTAQRQDDSIHSPMNCLPAAGWQPVRAERIQIADRRSSNATATINKVVVENGDERQVTLYWYQSQGRVIASEYSSKAQLFLGALRTGRSDAALVRIMSPITTAGEAAALADAQQFAEALLPLLSRFIPD